MERNEFFLSCVLGLIIVVGSTVLWNDHKSSQITPIVFDRNAGKEVPEFNLPVTPNPQQIAKSSQGIDKPIIKLNLNNVSLSELEQISGVGPKIANKIIDFRTANGPFGSVVGLDLIPGFGEGRVKSLSQYLEVPEREKVIPRPTPTYTFPSYLLRKETPQPKWPIDLNLAKEKDLIKLPGIGPVYAKKILEYRKQLRGYTQISQLLDIRGMGEKRLEEIRPYIILNNYRYYRNFQRKPSQKAVYLVNLNRDGVARLEKLPGIGPVRAQAIIDHRKNWGQFRSLEELIVIKGIGTTTLENLKPYVTLKP